MKKWLDHGWMHKFFEMINQELKVQRTKYQVWPNVGVRCLELGGGSKLGVFAHAYSVSALANTTKSMGGGPVCRFSRLAKADNLF